MTAVSASPQPYAAATARVGAVMRLLRHGGVIAPLLVAVISPACARSAGWTLQPNPGKGGLVSVSCASATSCVGVGGDTAEVWNGQTWSVRTVPSVATSYGAELNGVSCAAPLSCEAVGETIVPHVAGADDFGLAEGLQEVQWSLQETPVPPTPVEEYGGRLNAVSCVSATACIGVGQVQIAEEWNGSEWVDQTVPFANENTRMESVSCVTSSYCMAVGYGGGGSGAETLAGLWNGGSWTEARTARSKPMDFWELHSVSCLSQTFCISVGGRIVGTRSQPLVEVWNGSSWHLAATPKGFSELTGVSCTAPTFCTAVGANSPRVITERAPAIASWNGTSWTKQATPRLPKSLKMLMSVSCVAAYLCTAVGLDTPKANRIATLIEHEGGASTTAPAPSSPAQPVLGQ